MRVGSVEAKPPDVCCATEGRRRKRRVDTKVGLVFLGARRRADQAREGVGRAPGAQFPFSLPSTTLSFYTRLSRVRESPINTHVYNVSQLCITKLRGSIMKRVKGQVLKRLVSLPLVILSRRKDVLGRTRRKIWHSFSPSFFFFSFVLLRLLLVIQV